MQAAAEHEKLFIYECALEAAVALHHLALEVPSTRPDLRDQLRRASASIPLNIAEGAGEYKPNEKARFYRMARRSATECMAILDLTARITGPDPAFGDARDHLRALAAMLTNTVKAVEDRPKGPSDARPSA